eukprot:8004177-Pyramimonas_sp.AAC.1
MARGARDGGREVVLGAYCAGRDMFVGQCLAQIFAAGNAGALFSPDQRQPLVLHAAVHVDEPVIQQTPARVHMGLAEEVLAVPPHLRHVVARSGRGVGAPPAAS